MGALHWEEPAKMARAFALTSPLPTRYSQIFSSKKLDFAKDIDFQETKNALAQIIWLRKKIGGGGFFHLLPVLWFSN